MFGGLGKGAFPEGFGFPSVEKDGAYLQPFGSASVIYPPAQIAPQPITQFLATMQAYQLDVVPDAQTVYKQQGVLVPPSTTLLLVIQ